MKRFVAEAKSQQVESDHLAKELFARHPFSRSQIRPDFYIVIGRCRKTMNYHQYVLYVAWFGFRVRRLGDEKHCVALTLCELEAKISTLLSPSLLSFRENGTVLEVEDINSEEERHKHY